jgi:TonB family protein
MRRRGGALGKGVLGSVVLHALVLGAAWWMASRIEPPPAMRVYAVDIVSPPPVAEGDPAETTPVSADEAPAEPDPAPEPEPTPPDEPERPAPEPPPPPREEPAPAPRRDPPPERQPPPAEQEEPRPAPREPARGQDPDPTSPGGEGLNVRVEGAQFVDQDYLNNIVRQVHRYFRRPADSRTDRAEVRFRIRQDGSVAGIEVVRATGSFAFRAAAMEAVEQAGARRAFGPLPEGYGADVLPVSIEFRPAGPGGR